MNLMVVLTIALAIFLLIRFPLLRQPALVGLSMLLVAMWFFVRLSVVILALFGRRSHTATWLALDLMDRG